MSQDIALPSERGTTGVALADPPPGGVAGDLAQWAYEARQAFLIAQSLVQSSFVPASLRNKPNDVAVAILAGHEMGLQPMATLRSIDVIQGTPALRAHAMRGLLQSQGHSIQLVESTDDRCVMRGRRKGEAEWQEVEWTLDRAGKLGLTGKAEWRRQPRTMLVARATGEICRLVASDVIHAMPYVAEELGDDPAASDARPVSGRVTKEQLTGAPTTSAVSELDGSGPGGPSEAAEPQTAGSEALPPSDPAPRSGQPSTQKQRGEIHRLAGLLGVSTAEGEREEYLALLSDIACRPITSANDLSKTEAGWVIDLWLKKVAAAPTPEPEPAPADGRSADELLAEVMRAAAARGFKNRKAVEDVLLETYAQPIEDLEPDQLQEFLANLAYGNVHPPKE